MEAQLINSLREQIKELNFDNRNLKSQNKHLIEEASAFELHLQQVKKEKSDIERQNRQLREQIEIIIEEKEAEICEIKNQCQQHLQDKKRLEDLLIVNHKELKDVEDELINTQDKLEESKKLSDEMKKREMLLLEEICQLQMNLEAKESINNELREEVKDLQRDIRNYEDEIDCLKSERDLIAKRMVKKENDFESLQTILSLGGDINGNLTSITDKDNDVTSIEEIFDRDSITEARLSQINMIHRIDTSIELLASPIVPPVTGTAINNRRAAIIRVNDHRETSINEESLPIVSPVTSTAIKDRKRRKIKVNHSSLIDRGSQYFLIFTFVIFCFVFLAIPSKSSRNSLHYTIYAILFPELKVEMVDSFQ